MNQHTAHSTGTPPNWSHAGEQHTMKLIISQSYINGWQHFIFHKSKFQLSSHSRIIYWMDGWDLRPKVNIWLNHGFKHFLHFLVLIKQVNACANITIWHIHCVRFFHKDYNKVNQLDIQLRNKRSRPNILKHYTRFAKRFSFLLFLNRANWSSSCILITFPDTSE